MRKSQDLPAHCCSRLRLRVRFFETDLMGIVHHSNYVNYLEAGRLDYLRKRNFDYRGLTERGFHMPVVEVSIRYRKVARFDDELIVEARPTALTRVTVDFGYRVLRPAAEGEELVATGRTLLACVGEDHRPCAIPIDLREVVLMPEGSADASSG